MRQFLIGSAEKRAGLALLLFCTLIVRMIVPAGFMPAVGGDRVTVTLCSGTAGATITIDLGGDDHPADEAGDSWVFAAGLAGSPLAPDPAELPSPGPAARAMRSDARIADLTPHRLAAPPPPSQAPPAHG